MDPKEFEKLASIVESMGETIKALTEERDAARSKLASKQRREDAEKLAFAMIQKGVSSTPFEDLADDLEKAASEGRFEEIRRAVDLVGPDMGRKIAAELRNNDTPGRAAGHDPITAYLLGSAGLARTRLSGEDQRHVDRFQEQLRARR